jgi:hypothetical protein
MFTAQERSGVFKGGLKMKWSVEEQINAKERLKRKSREIIIMIRRGGA